MNLSISNIGWSADQDSQVYELMRTYGFSGLEIAPTRIFPEAPYDHLSEAEAWVGNLQKKYSFSVPSMQSIWYGRKEKILGSDDEFRILLDYTKKAIDFAAAIHCKNLVFGCPGNRSIPEGADSKEEIRFFKLIGDYAALRGTVIGMEANPSIYNTNFINYTEDALNLIEQVDSEGFRLNLDIGTMICNQEDPQILKGRTELINHVHISEPWLKPIEHRTLHRDIMNILNESAYQGYVSIEMGKVEEIQTLEDAMIYVKSVFND